MQFNSISKQKIIYPILICALSAITGAVIVFVENISWLFIISLPVGLTVGVFSIGKLPFLAIKAIEFIKKIKLQHLLIFIIFVSGFVFRTRTRADIQENPVDVFAGARIALVGIAGIIAILSLGKSKARLKFITFFPFIFILIYSLMGMFSSLWSINPLWSFYKSAEYLVCILVMILAVTQCNTIQDWEILFTFIWLLVGLMVISTWMGVMIFPEIAIFQNVGLLYYQIQGVIPSIASNGVGEYSAILTILLFVRIVLTNNQRMKLVYIVTITPVVITLLFSQSRTPLAGLAAGVIIILVASKKYKLLFIFSGIVIIALIVDQVSVLLMDFLRRGQNPEMMMTLSGRANWWETSTNYIVEKPVLGYGAYAGGRYLVIDKDNLSSSIHNTWIETLVGLGVLGTLVLLIALLGSWRELLRKNIFAETNNTILQLKYQSIGVLAILTVRSFFSVPLIWHPPIIWLLIIGFSTFIYHANLNRLQLS